MISLTLVISISEMGSMAFSSPSPQKLIPEGSLLNSSDTRNVKIYHENLVNESHNKKIQNKTLHCQKALKQILLYILEKIHRQDQDY